ncbi:MAG TPA: N-acetyl-alpha-D-glucosaminyl L-malate synthase BshA [Flavobacteriales bacterium]|nr:N-acetyl-alpha-D-glucosaminyl L-malate synthase BshA [Flavobacteriales bacterium]
MRIGIVCYPTFGGSGVVATELGIALAKKGHQVHFITYHQPARLDVLHHNIFYHEVRVSDYPLFDYTPYELVLTSKIVNVVKYEKLDILHVHYAIPHASAAYMAQRILEDQGISIPFVTTLHGTDITLVGKDASFEPVITFCINKSTAVTAVSESLKLDTFAFFNVSREIEVIPNFINNEQYKNIYDAGLRKRYAPRGEFLISHISNFRKVKRIEDVVLVFDQIRKKVPAKLLLVGDGPERSVIEKMCREIDICTDAILLGKLQSTKEVLAISDLFLLPSETESFGLAALEAMAAGVPVISTNTGGLPEVNVDGVTGFAADVGDIDYMATNALSLLQDKEKMATFRRGALAQAQKFDMGVILGKYEELYDKALQTTLKNTLL